MGLPRLFFYVGVRAITAVIGVFGLAWDITGSSVFTLSSGSWGVIGLIAFGAFIIITVIKDIDTSLQPHPKVEYDGLSPAKSSIIDKVNGQLLGTGYFVRLAFKNNAKNPSGENSTANSTTAFIKLIDKTGNVIDSWEGRWANNGEPSSFPNKWEADKLKLEANNQQAILDIGYRLIGENRFCGWDNGRYFGAPPRKYINPGSYEIHITLAASNYKKREWRFSLFIPNEPESDNMWQVQIKPVKKPKFRKAGSQP